MKYAVIYEKGKTGYGAYVPDLPGCVAVGKSLPHVQKLIRDAIEFHIQGMRAAGEAVPVPSTRSGYVHVRSRITRRAPTNKIRRGNGKLIA